MAFGSLTHLFALLSLPGAIGMFALSIGVGRIQQSLPDPVYALLSGLNASTVGIIALAAVQLSEGAIKDKLTRILVIFGALMGLCYTALWYFPVIMLAGGSASVIWDLFLNKLVLRMQDKLKKKKSDPEDLHEKDNVAVGTANGGAGEINPEPLAEQEDQPGSQDEIKPAEQDDAQSQKSKSLERTASRSSTSSLIHAIPLKVGILIIVGFFCKLPVSLPSRKLNAIVSFIAVLVARGVVNPLPRALAVFANMYLAGTIIFGGGPVVIPLLREYVVQPGWVSTRDFLIGLAIIQAFPGPNFNFAVYLGALSLRGTQWPNILGAVLGYFGIFIPGITLAVGVQSVWRILRSKPAVVSSLRGINATAVGLIFTAVYRLWTIGYLTNGSTAGQSLGMDPFWLVVAALAYAETSWFRVPPAISIVFGAILGLAWYGAVGRFKR
jgi:chromate transport protein ChrA